MALRRSEWLEAAGIEIFAQALNGFGISVEAVFLFQIGQHIGQNSKTENCPVGQIGELLAAEFRRFVQPDLADPGADFAKAVEDKDFIILFDT